MVPGVARKVACVDSGGVCVGGETTEVGWILPDPLFDYITTNTGNTDQADTW